MAFRSFAAFAAALGFTAWTAACGSSSSSAGFGTGVGAGDDAGGSGGDDGSSMSFTPGDDDSGTFLLGDDDSGSGQACAASSSKGQQQDLDVYMMLDQSISMVGPKWNGVVAAITSFVQQPGLTGVSVGIQYFALNAASCNASDYATPEVEIAPLPGVASKITASLAMHVPSTVTPTLPAEQGAVQHAQAWAKSHPGHAVIVVLATDGEPDFCSVNLADVNAAAAAGVSGTPKILTFVIGVGNDLTSLNATAAAGGTSSAFIVDTSSMTNVNAQFLAALNKIRGNALGCTYKIPAPTNGGSVDFTKVNVQFVANGKTDVFPQVASKAACPASGDAWYYDDAAAPTNILLCTSTCGTVSAGGTLNVLTGCQTVVVK